MTETKSCPMCGTEAAHDVAQCDCGYVFASTSMQDADAGMTITADAPGANWRTAGWALAVLGAIGLGFSLYMDTAITGYGLGSSDIVNLDLMFQKGVAVACSLSAIGLGVFCLGIGAIVAALNRRSD